MLATLGLQLLATIVGPTTPEDTRLDFARLSTEFLTSHDIAAESFAEVLDTPAFVHVELGSYDLHIPRHSLRDKQAAEQFEETARALIGLQRAWFAWKGAESAGDVPVEDDWKTLEKWVKGWNPGKLAKADGGQESLYDQLGAKADVVEAQARLRDYTRPPAATVDAVGELNVLVLAPTRKDFLDLVAVGGRVHEADRYKLWNDATIGQSVAWVGWTEVASMEYAMLPPDFDKPFRGTPMTEQDKTGLLQYMVDRGAALLLRKEFWRHGTHFFEEALGTNLVIQSIGRNGLYAGEWAIEYKTSGASTQPYSRFVPGGNPAGGTLPPRSAKSKSITTVTGSSSSRYREGDGEDFFIPVLKDGQKDGAKLAQKADDNPLKKDKTAHFVLASNASNDETFVTAPFLGASAENKPLPANEYLDDYEDFFRAYRSGFLFWLREHGAGDETESEAKFADLIQRHGTRAVGTPLDSIVQQVYGVPLSSHDPEDQSLEWRYLAWLKKGR